MQKTAPMSSRSPKKHLLRDPLLKAAMDEILQIQPRFAAEPCLGPKGKGFLKSEGTEGLLAARARDGRAPRKAARPHLHR